MKNLDMILQGWRIRKARPFIPAGGRVLDIGSADGALFRALESHIGGGLGIDPTLKETVQVGKMKIIPGFFPGDMPEVAPFDAITMLAVLEHIPEAGYESLSGGCARFLKPRGHLIITVPSPLVDHILKVLKALRLVDGMSLEEHHGYRVGQTTRIFAPPVFHLVCRKHFQLGLNNLFVFEREK
jgi:2-polyprenyl-3-methyl-5-hydroxy-6-metoxy-1,4-benzoquinol methylase